MKSPFYFTTGRPHAGLFCIPLQVWGLGLAGCCLAIDWISASFHPDSPLEGRPILGALCLLSLAFAFYLLAVNQVRKGSGHLRTILGYGILFRLILLPSWPIQEVDLHRYLWDGRVLEAGISPYRYAPSEVDDALAGESLLDGSLVRLGRISKQSPTPVQWFERVHHREIPTAYPPVSQLVFWLASLTMSDGSPEVVHVLTLKVWMILLDLGVCLVLWRWLGYGRRARLVLISYAWCPLVLKEFANSAHLDSIAVFFTVLAVRTLLAQPDKAGSPWAGVWWATAVLAKVFPIILFPYFAWRWLRKGNLRTCMIRSLGSFSLVVGVWVAMDAWTISGTSLQPGRSLQGLRTFAQEWEMNDALFMGIYENLRPESTTPGTSHWFAPLSGSVGLSRSQDAFQITRWMTMLAWLSLALGCLYRADKHPSLRKSGELIFLWLAWFWYLSPTQNPWYWTWAMPFLGFSRNPGWFLTSAAAMTYYLRFWLLYETNPDTPLIMGYRGVQWFDYVWVWAEHGIPLLCVGYFGLARYRKNLSRRTEQRLRAPSVDATCSRRDSEFGESVPE